MIADVGHLHQFLRNAEVGDTAVYHVGLLTCDRSTSGPLNKVYRERLDTLANAVLKAAGFVKDQNHSDRSEEPLFYQAQPGLVALVQRRIGPRTFEYLMQRTARPYKSETPVEQAKKYTDERFASVDIPVGA